MWFLLLDGLSSAVWACPKPYQPAALDTLFCLLRSTVQCPGPGFALYVTNRLLLPLIQSWLRQPSTTCAAGSRPETNLRQACGLATDLVVDFLQQFAAPAGEAFLKWESFSQELMSSKAVKFKKMVSDLLEKNINTPHYYYRENTVVRLYCIV